jgi:hypothetical protein
VRVLEPASGSAPEPARHSVRALSLTARAHCAPAQP